MLPTPSWTARTLAPILGRVVMVLVLTASSLAAALARPLRIAGTWLFRTIGAASLMLACGPRTGPQMEKGRPPAGENARPQPTRTLEVLETQSFALICPEGATLQGGLPPEGREAFCVAPEGRPHGPSARWTRSGELVELHLHSKEGSLQWSLTCERVGDGVAGHWLSGDKEELGTLKSQRCEEIAQMLLGL